MTMTQVQMNPKALQRGYPWKRQCEPLKFWGKSQYRMVVSCITFHACVIFAGLEYMHACSRSRYVRSRVPLTEQIGPFLPLLSSFTDAEPKAST